MWSPKRVLLLGLGFAVFFGAFAVYAYFLGRFDGLRPLPEQYSPEKVSMPGAPELPPEPKERNEDRKLQMAFGDGCPELKRTIKLEIGARRLVLTADHYEIQSDGRILLKPFSIAIFGKELGPAQTPEINTIRSDQALLRFDQPIIGLAEIGNRKIVGLELCGDPKQHAEGGDPGGVTLMNNRRSAQRGNELRLFTPGPVFYEETRHMIWTKAPVEIKDYQGQPEPTVITAIGMDVTLTPESQTLPAAQHQAGKHERDARHRSKAANVGGVDRLHLRSDVEMHLWVDANSGFLGSGKEPAAHASAPVISPGSAALSVRPSQPDIPEKAQVVINTQGPFVYDLRTDVARFDILQQHEPRRRPDQVHVYRLQKRQGIYDHLICDHLEIEFRRKPPTAASSGKSSGGATAAAQDPSTSLEMQSAHAWADGDHEVVLTSDAEVLEARGNDLVYDAERRRTTLKGRPKIIVLKDGNQIDAQELELVGMGQKQGQQARIKGPGEIGMLDNVTKQRTLHARWKDTLISTKEGAFDVLLLTGDATFEDLDKEHPQQLQADELKVWLHPGDDKVVAKPRPAAGNDSQRRRPHHLEALGNVQARSREMNVHHTERLIVWFKDAPQPLKGLGGPPPVAAESTHTAGKSTTDDTGLPAPQATPTPPTPAPESAPKPANAPSKTKKPIDLTARTVEAHVLRLGNRNELERVACDGNVRVHQDPEVAQPGPDDKGVDIHGQTLEMTRFPEGNVLVVHGEPAEVNMEKLSILGPEVHIDQKENKAWVNGLGSMRLPSNTTFQGAKLVKPTMLTVHWNESMLFDGKFAEFHGGVQAEQDSARLACRGMQVFFDRFISLKQGDKSQTPAKVKNLVCDKQVSIEDTTRQNGRLIEYKRIRSIELSVDNELGLVKAPGPGVVWIHRLGAKGEALPAPSTPKVTVKPKEEQELKLTRVAYQDWMHMHDSARTVTFYTNVEVVHAPTDNPDMKIDVDHLPPGGLYLQCQQLDVYSRKEANGTTRQEMTAKHKAMVHSQEFWGLADVIKYDESEEKVIFEGIEGNLATLYRVKVQGGAPEVIKGRKILYWRRTNLFRVEDGTKIDATLSNNK